MPNVRVGLIGAGNISDTHARAVAAVPGASVVAVYGPTRARAERLAASVGAQAHDRLDAFLAQGGMDMVIVGTPSGLHGEHGAAAARAGLHVLVEKPLEITTARADRLIAAAAGAGVTLGVIFQDRLKPSVERLKTLVESRAGQSARLKPRRRRTRAMQGGSRSPDRRGRQSSMETTWSPSTCGADHAPTMVRPRSNHEPAECRKTRHRRSSPTPRRIGASSRTSFP